MKKLSGILCLLLILSSSLLAQETKIIIHDEFNNNDNNWPLIDDNATKILLEHSGFTIRSFTDNGSQVMRETSLDYSGNFSISAELRQVKGEDGYGYGILFGFKDWDNFYEFEITDNGYYRITHKDQGISTNTGWVRDANTPAKDAPCRLKIIKVNDWVGFYLEEPGDAFANIFTHPSFVNMIRADGFAGRKIGFVTNGKIGARFSNFTVLQLGMDAVAPLTDVLNSLLNGTDPESVTLLNDDFSSNNNQWPNGIADSSHVMGLKDGAYSFEELDNKGRIAKQSIFLACGSDYEIQCRTKHVNGSDSSYYGIAWGFKDWDNTQEFEINSKGSCRYRYNLYGNSKSITASFKPEAENLLKASRKKDSLYFYINGQLVIKAPDLSPSGSDAGFVVFNRQKVLFDDLKITQVKAFPAEANPITVAEETMQKNEGPFSEEVESESSSIDWEEGMVTYEHKDNNGGSFYKNCYKNPLDDFTISEKLKWIEGDSTQAYGVLWGYRNWDNYNAFLISKNGYFKCDITHNKTLISTGWRRFNGFAKNDENTLEVKRKGSATEYFINGQLAAVLPFYELYGYSDGIIIYGKQTVGLKNLTVKTIPVDKPEFDRGKVFFSRNFDTAENVPENTDEQIRTYKDGRLYLSAHYPGLYSSGDDDTDYPLNNPFHHQYTNALPGVSEDGKPSLPFSVEATVGLFLTSKTRGAGLAVGGIDFLVDSHGKYTIGDHQPKAIGDENMPSSWIYRLKVVYDRSGMLNFYINEKMVEAVPASMMDNNAGVVVYAHEHTTEAWFDDLIVRSYQ